MTIFQTGWISFAATTMNAFVDRGTDAKMGIHVESELATRKMYVSRAIICGSVAMIKSWLNFYYGSLFDSSGDFCSQQKVINLVVTTQG